jgi:hypothetical protein
MDQTTRLLAEIDAFLPTSGIAQTTFGRMAVGDSKFVARIRAGGGLTLKTAEKVQAFIKGWEPRVKQPRPTHSVERAA